MLGGELLGHEGPGRQGRSEAKAGVCLGWVSPAVSVTGVHLCCEAPVQLAFVIHKSWFMSSDSVTFVHSQLLI